MSDQPTHADLMTTLQRAMKSISEKQDEFSKQHTQAAASLARLEEKMGRLTEAVGTRGLDEHGAVIGTGITGDVARLQQRLYVIDGWRRYLAGGMAVAAIFLAIIWWLLSDKVELLLK